MANIETRTVQSAGINSQSMISGNSFIIKEYQRGYRWESQQVENLLQDLQEFNHYNHTVKYCMQPLVVKRVELSDNSHARELSQIIGSTSTADSPDVMWELIDGQQRLTTTLLILDSCNQKPPKLPYRIFYSLMRDIDAYYINNATLAYIEQIKGKNCHIEYSSDGWFCNQDGTAYLNGKGQPISTVLDMLSYIKANF